VVQLQPTCIPTWLCCIHQLSERLAVVSVQFCAYHPSTAPSATMVHDVDGWCNPGGAGGDANG
jgi:hypothetical protein